MVKHVDRNALYTNLEARVSYLKEFIEFGQGDLDALERGYDLVRQVIPDIVNSVYSKLLKTDVTARVFSTRDSRDDEDPPKWPQDGSAAIQNRKIFLRWYLTRLNQDPSKKEFWEYLDKVGEMHVGAGRRNPLHVDYLFLGICMGYIQDAFTESILSNTTVDLRLRINIVRALGKLIWIQNDLLARWHINENNIGVNPNPQPQTSGLPKSGGTSPMPGHAHLAADTQSLNPFTPEVDDSRNTSDSASYAGSNKTSLGRSKDSMDGYSPSSGSSGGQCPFSGQAMDNQRVGLGWPLSNSRASSSDRPDSRQRGWL